MKKIDLNRSKELLGQVSQYDWVILLLIVTSLAFYDIKLVFLGMQAVAFAVTGLHLIARPKVKNHVLLYGAWIAGFCLYSLLSCLWAGDDNTTAFSTTLSTVQVGLIGGSILIYCRNQKKLNWVINAFFVAAFILCIRFVIEVPISEWGAGGRFSKETIFGKNTPALVLSHAAVMSLWRCFFAKKKSRNRTIVYLLMASVFAFIPLLMGTKNGLLILGVGIAVMLLGCAKDKKELLKSGVIIAVLAAVVLIAIFNIPLLYGAIGYRIERMVVGLMTGEGNSSTVTRMRYYADSIRVFLQNPIFGVGQDGYRYVNSHDLLAYSHCNYTELLANLGIVGLGLFYAFYCWTARQAFRVRKTTLLPLILIVTILVVDITLVSYSYEMNYVILAIAFGSLQCVPGADASLIGVLKNTAEKIRKFGLRILNKRVPE